jgi:hypothetical protein
LAGIELEWGGIKPGCPLKNLAAKTAVDHSGIVLVIVKRDAGDND